MTEHVSRRRFIRTGVAAGGAVAVAGCTADDEQPDEEPDTEADADQPPELPVVEDPPNAVYVPTHFEAMRHLDPVEAGEFELLPMVTYPHQFWNVTGNEVEIAEPEGDDVHLMVAVRDAETGTVLPVETGLEIAVGPEGEASESHAPWPMISQEMGFHIGDNMPLGDEGTYEVDVTVGSIDIERTGEFAGRFEESATGTFTFEFDQAFRDEVVGGIAYLDEEHWGQPGALAPMMHGDHGHHDHGGHDDGHHDDGHHDDGHHDDEPQHDDDEHNDDHHDDEHHHEDGHGRFGTFHRESDVTELPPADELPGELLGEPQSGDAVIAATVLDAESRFVDEADEYYLAVSPRTPYNRGMLPMMTIDATVERDGEEVIDTQLTDTLDHELGYHYALRTDDLETGDTLTLSFPAPPQVSRHAGYETAFLDMDPVEYTIEL